MLLKRTVFEQMIAAFPTTRYTYDFVNRKEFGLFRAVRSAGLLLPLARAGGKIWLDTEGRLNHTGPHIFRGQGLK
jgi:hypothetical protein